MKRDDDHEIVKVIGGTDSSQGHCEGVDVCSKTGRTKSSSAMAEDYRAEVFKYIDSNYDRDCWMRRS